MRQCSSRVTCAFALLFSVCTGCSHRIGEPDDSQELMRPQDVVSFERLYRQNCSACHGEGGRNGPALDLANPAYQALVDDTSLKHWITSGMPGTQMPAFGESAGGLLTVKQVDALVDGIRKSWASERQRPAAGMPPYVADLAGNAGRGAKIYETACLSCHQQRRQQIIDTAYLSLVSDQVLRTIIIAGRPDLGHPDWRNVKAGYALSNQDVTDVVAYLDSLRSTTPGQPYPERKTVER